MPIVIPQEYHNYRLVSIDPGTVYCGVAVYEIDSYLRQIKTIEAFTINTEKLPNRTGLDEEYFGERLIKLIKLKMALTDFIYRIQPWAVACESPFYNRFRPMAYGALLETLSYIHTAVLDVDTRIFFKTIEPLLVKKSVGAGIMKGKIDVRYCVENNQEIMSVLNSDIDALDEHGIDAIAVGYAFIKNSGVLI